MELVAEAEPGQEAQARVHGAREVRDASEGVFDNKGSNLLAVGGPLAQVNGHGAANGAAKHNNLALVNVWASGVRCRVGVK